jgi:SAM-dependent methyltransferase
MENNYFYPDVNDKITAALIKKEEPCEGCWEKSEKEILTIIKQTMREQLKKTGGLWLFDAGCGTGRLLHEFEAYFDKILAVDPDVKQIDKAANLAKQQEFAGKTVFEAVPIEEFNWPRDSIDVILCSHVIQHVRTENVPRILNKFGDLIKKDGLLFIMTTHSSRKTDFFVKDYLNEGEFIEENIDEEEFNSLVKNDLNVLPLHFFSLNSITKELRDSGFALQDFYSYHILSQSIVLDKVIERDQIANRSKWLKSKTGRDMLIIGKKIVKQVQTIIP